MQLLFVLVLIFSSLVSIASAQSVNVPTWRYDTTHAGQNTKETTLTPSNVASASFGKLFSQAVDGYVVAQPLYVSGLTMSDGLVHNVLFVATEHDSVYAFDADTNGGTNAQPIWQISLLGSAYGASVGATTVPSTDLGTKDLVPEIGITGTPAINLATQTMYFVGATKESGTYIQRLHAINILTGAERPNSPTVIQATVAGTGVGSAGGSLVFSPLWQMNRGAIDYYNGYVYIPYGSHGDNGPYHGWLFAYDATQLTQTGVLCLSPNGYGDGVWGAGAGLPIDTEGTAGRLYLSTGNGTYTAYPPFNGNANYGDSVVQFSLANGSLTPTDAFTPFNQATLAYSDLDQGSGGVLLPPDQQGSYPHILIQVGKEGRILVINRDNMGGYAPGGTNNPNILQDIPGQVRGLWSTPAYWNGNVYFWGSADYAKSFSLTNGVLSQSSLSTSTVKSNFPGPSMVISANGTQSGIAWAARTDAYGSNGSEVLFAFDATNLATVLYASSNTARDDAGPAVKFVVPVVTNGKVYLGAAYQVDVYGLLGGQATTAAPMISPNGGTFSGVQNVTLSSATNSASMYYTLDGSVPTTAATLYTAPIPISSDTTVRAIASANGYVQSSVSSASFILNTQTPSVTLSPAAGTYSTPQNVVLSDIDPTAKIHYTLDGSAPTASSPLYTAPIAVGASVTLKAIAIDPGLSTNSNVTAAAYVIQAGGSTIDFGSGFASVVGLTLNGSTKNTDDSRLQLTDGGTGEAGSVFFTQPINIQAFTTDFSFQLSSAKADGFTFAIQNAAAGAKALGLNGGSLGYGSPNATGGILKSVAIKFDFYSNAGEGSNSTGVFSNGAYPTTPAVDLTSSGIQLSSGDSIQAHVTYDGTTLTMVLTDVIVNKTFTLTKAINIPQTVGGNTAYVGFTGGTGGASASQKILSWTYASKPAAATTASVTFAPAGGVYASPQSVTLSDATPGAVIYYTTDGTTPTASSRVYSTPIAVTYGTTAIETVAQAPGYALSAINGATYVVSEPTTPPVIAPVGGSYMTVQTVTISDGDASAIVHYTLDGSQPTAASPVYTAPITVSSSETINAIAVDPALQNSSVATAAYVISIPTGPAITYGSGFASASGLALNGPATVSGNLLQLSNGQLNLASSAYFATPVNIQAFTTTFNFQLLNAIADGFTFTIQNQGPKALGHTGSSLGYGSSGTTGGITPSVAVKFDFHNNGGEGNNSTGLYLNGAQPTVPANDMTASGIALSSGDIFQAQLSYNGTTLTLTLTDTVTGQTYERAFAVNIPQIVGGSTAYVGFTAGAGGTSSTQNILNWTFGNTTSATTPAPNPVFSPVAGTYSAGQTVTITDGDGSAAIHYTVDGSQPTAASPAYAGPITLSTSTTINAIAIDAALANSGVATAAYVVSSTGAPVINDGTGFPSASGLALNGPATVTGNLLQLSNGQLNLASSAYSTTPVNIQSFTTTFSFQDLKAVADGFTFTIQNAGLKALGHSGASLGYGTSGTTGGIPTSVAVKFDLHSNAGEGNDSTGLYLNGAQPTLPANDMTASGVLLGSGDTMQAQLSYNGTTLTLTLTDTVSGKVYTQAFTVNIPQIVGGTTAYVGFTAGTGGSSATQNILNWTFSNTTAAAAVTAKAVSAQAGDGQAASTTPALSQTDAVEGASSAVAVPRTIAPAATVANGSAASTSGGAKLRSTTGAVAAEPRLVPAPGVLLEGSGVQLLSSSPAAVTYYTTDGSQPTKSSLVYHSSIMISGDALTVKAFSSVPGRKDSAVITGTYHVQE